MEFIDEFKPVVRNTLAAGELKNAESLFDAFYDTGLKADAELLYLQAYYFYCKKQYGLSLYFTRLSLKHCENCTAAVNSGSSGISNVLGNNSGNDFGTEFIADAIELYEELTDSKYESGAELADVTAYNRRLNILMYKGLISIVDYTVDIFAEYYRALGHRVYILDISEKNTKLFSEFLGYVKGGIDFVHVFNNNIYKVRREDDGRDYLESLNIPVFDYMFDHPMYFRETFDSLPENYVVTCVDRNHNKYLKRFYPNVKNHFFLPLGGEEYVSDEYIPWSERKIEALYVGSLKRNDSACSDELAGEIIELLIKNTGYTAEEAIEKCFLEKNPGADREAVKAAIDKYHFADLNANCHFRKKLVETLVNGGIDVWVYGGGWDETDLTSKPHFHYGGWLKQTECIELMKNTRFVLNSMPWFKDGAHDRIYNAMLAGAVCVTDGSRYLSEQFEDGRELVFYSLDNIEALPKRLKELEADVEAAQTMADYGYGRVAVFDTWQNRTIELLEHFFDNKKQII